MPLCTVADVKIAARVDPDLVEWDGRIAALILSATREIEHSCNVPRGWFDQPAEPTGAEQAREACIILAALRLDDVAFDGRKILGGSLLDDARHYGDTPSIPVPPPAPTGSLSTGTGWLSLAAGALTLTPTLTPTGALMIGGGYMTTSGGSLALTA